MANKQLLVTGSRDWDDYDVILNALFQAYQDLKPTDMNPGQTGGVVLLSGACPSGADLLAEQIWSDKIGRLWISRHPADWEAHGKAAGFIRNKEMVDKNPDLCVAFIKNGSKGATHTANLAQAAGIETRIYTS